MFRRAAGIGCPAGENRPLRLHDLRHTAAVHRVVAWYRAGHDVRRLLPQWQPYLGHADLRSTQRYLQMTPELLRRRATALPVTRIWGTVMNDKQLPGPGSGASLEYLVAERNLSGNTQASYRDTLTLLLPFASASVGHATRSDDGSRI